MLALLSVAVAFHDELDAYLAGAGPADAARAAFPTRFDQTALADWLTHINLAPRSTADLNWTFGEMDADLDGAVSFQELTGEMEAWFGSPRRGTRTDAFLETRARNGATGLWGRGRGTAVTPSMTNALFVSMGTSSTQAYCWTVADGNHGKPQLDGKMIGLGVEDGVVRTADGDVLIGLSFPQNENGNAYERYSYKGSDEMIAVDVYKKAENSMCATTGGSYSAKFAPGAGGEAGPPDFQSWPVKVTNIGECQQKCAETPECTAIDYRAEDKTCRTYVKCDQGDLQTADDWVAYYDREVKVDPTLVPHYAKMVQEWRTVCGADHVVFVNSAGYGVSLPPDPQRFVQLFPAGDMLSKSQNNLDPLIPNQVDKGKKRADKNDGKKLQSIATQIGGTVWVWPRGGPHKDSYVVTPEKAALKKAKYKNPEQTWVSSVYRENGLMWDVGGGSATLYFEKNELEELVGDDCMKEAWEHKLKSDEDDMNDYIAKVADAHKGTEEQVKTLINERATAFAERLKALAKRAKCMGALTVDVYVTGMLREWFYITDQHQARYKYAKHFLDTVEAAIKQLTPEVDGLRPGKVEFLQHETEAKQEAAEFLRNGQAKNKEVVEALAAGYTSAKKAS